MKQLLSIIAFLASSFLLHSQCGNQFSIFPSIDNYFREVNIQRGGLAWEETFFIEGTQKDYFSTFANSLWLAGQSPSGNVHISLKTYFANDPGPLNSNGNVFENSCDYFDRLWVISGSQINIHKENYNQGNINLQNTPKDILEWPAKGNVLFDVGAENGNTLDQDLAPFFDTNGDGVYSALDGDVPIYKGGVQFNSFDEVWAPYLFSLNIVNDGNSADDYVQAERLKVEILQSCYMLNCPENEDLNYSIFYNFSVNYKGETEISGFKAAYWEDVDFGCYDNDYLGCKPSLNTAYAYNEDPIEDACVGGGLEPIDLAWGMSKNTILLSHDMSSFILYFNPATGIPPPATVDPSSAVQAYNLMCGRWLDGSPLTTGGTGYNPGSSNETLFAFPDFPNDPAGWSMFSVNLFQGDTRSVMGIDVQDNLSPGDNFVVEVASHVLFDPFTSHLGIFDILEERTQNVKDAYQTIQNNPQELDHCAVAQNCVDDCVWPGNVLADDIVNASDVLLYGAILGKGWNNGSERDQKGSLWAPHEAQNWNEELANQNIKHADCNGDGVLNENDIQIFSENFNLVKPNVGTTPNMIAEHDPEGFKIAFDKEEIDLTGNFISRVFNFSIRPREDGESFDFDYHGVSFDIVFDSSLVVPMGGFGFEINQNYFNDIMFTDAKYRQDENLENDLILKGDNRISVMATSSNGENQSPSEGLITQYAMIALEDATTSNTDGRDTIQLRLENVTFMDADGNILEEDVGYYSGELIITGLGFAPEVSSVDVTKLNLALNISPNPTTGDLIIHSESSQNGVLSIANLDGVILERFDFEANIDNHYNLSHLPAGVYILQLKNLKGQLTGIEKLVLID